MRILSINLESGEKKTEELVGASAFSYAIDYLEKDKSALFIIAPSADRKAEEVAFIYTSPISSRLAIAHSNLSLKDFFNSFSYDVILIENASRKLSYITFDKDSAEIYPSESLRGRGSLRFSEILKKNPEDVALATGPAGDNGVVFASLQYDGGNIYAEGLGNVFYQKNLKGMIFSIDGEKKTESVEGKLEKRIQRSELYKRIKREGSATLVSDALRLGWAPVKYYNRRFDPRAYHLDGKSMIDKYGVNPKNDCTLSCMRLTLDNEPLPSWKDLLALGTNLGIFSLDSVIELYRAALEEGLDTVHLGAILSYVLSLRDDDMHWLGLKDRSIAEIVSLIHRIGSVKDAGLRYKDGLKAFPDAYKNGYNQPFLYDIRGQYGEALMSLLGIDLELYISLIRPKHEMDERCSVILAFYEAVYSLALISLGYSPFAAASFSEYIPEIAYHNPALARFFMRTYRPFGLKSKELFRIGLPIFKALAGDTNYIPEHFRENGVSALSFRTVSPVRLLSSYTEEMLKAEIWLKSNRDIRRAESSSSKIAVGPKEDLGRDGDPGLSK